MHVYLHNTYITEIENCFKHMGKAGTVTTITWNRHDINLTGDQIQCLSQHWKVNDTRTCWLNDNVRYY